MPADRIDAATAEQVLGRMGLPAWPALDEAGLAAVYRAWCRSVPFDNVRKLIAFGERHAGPLPGMDADDFFAAWARHGTGGTCWPSNNGLHALLRACGFDARLVASSMLDLGSPTHGTTVVTIDGAEWLVDSSMHTDAPVPVARDHATTLDHPVFPTTVALVAEGWLIDFSHTSSRESIPCRTISPDGVTYEFCAQRYEATREGSPFNVDLVAHRNDASGVTTVRGRTRFRRTAHRLQTRELDEDGVTAALVDDLGLSEEIVHRLARAQARRTRIDAGVAPVAYQVSPL